MREHFAYDLFTFHFVIDDLAGRLAHLASALALRDGSGIPDKLEGCNNRGMSLWARYALLAAVTTAGSAHWVAGTDSTPAFYAVPPQHTVHPLLAGNQLTGPSFSHPYQVKAYVMAAKVEKALYAQPCYCRCDRALRHQSLHSCFEGTHGAECATCMRQGVYTYQQTKLGKTPDEIRAGIQRGEAESVDVINAPL